MCIECECVQSEWLGESGWVRVNQRMSMRNLGL